MGSAIPPLKTCGNGRLHASGVRLLPWLGSCTPRCEGLNSPFSTLIGNGAFAVAVNWGGMVLAILPFLSLGGGNGQFHAPGVRLCRGWDQRPLMSR